MGKLMQAYEAFLRERRLVRPEAVTYCVGWVVRFLEFARSIRERGFEHCLTAPACRRSGAVRPPRRSRLLCVGPKVPADRRGPGPNRICRSNAVGGQFPLGALGPAH